VVPAEYLERRYPMCPACDAVLLRVGESAESPRAIPPAFREGARAIGPRAGVADAGYRRSAGPTSRRWVFRWVRWFETLCVIAFAALLLVGGGAMVVDVATHSHAVRGTHHTSHGASHSDSTWGLVAGICLGLFGAGLLYLSIAEIRNRTTIELGPLHLTAKSGPLPTSDPQRANTNLPSGDIARFEVRPSTDPHHRGACDVLAVHFDGHPSLVLRMSPRHAVYIAAELDDALRGDDPIA
jgi:hypothetical protein